MQIRLTVLGPRPEAPGQERNGDVLVTAPAGTALGAVAPALAAAVGGEGQPVLYAGGLRLDPQRATLGEPPLTDGAVLHLGVPGEQGPDLAGGAAQLHVVAGPDAGGVHLLHGGQIRIGRSADADVPLDDPDVSRLHCAITVSPDGRITVTDLGSTNGTEVDGSPIGTEPVRLAPGALLRLGESTLRLAPAGGFGAVLRTAPDGEGHLRVAGGRELAGGGSELGPSAAGGASAAGAAGDGTGGGFGSSGAVGPSVKSPSGSSSSGAFSSKSPLGQSGSEGASPHSPYGSPGSVGASSGAGAVPPSPGYEPGAGAPSTRVPQARVTTEGGGSAGQSGATRHQYGDSVWDAGGDDGFGADGPGAHGSGQRDTPLPGAPAPRGARRRGLAAFARLLTGGAGREEPPAEEFTYPPQDHRREEEAAPDGPACPDPAELLLTALGPGPRLWERGAQDPQALTVRLGLGEPPAGGRRPVPLTVGLRQTGSLGLAGPQQRVAGLARSVLAQLAALHAPDELEIVLLTTGRAAAHPGTATGGTDWSWLGWLPHVRPGHGQDCRLLLAYDREQATARTGELLRRLEDGRVEGAAGAAGAGPAGPGPTSTVLVVDGDPGSASLREAVRQLALEGGPLGIHVLCLAPTPGGAQGAGPAGYTGTYARPGPAGAGIARAGFAGSPLEALYEAACEASPAFGACAAVGLVTGDVGTTVQLVQVAGAGVGDRRSGEQWSQDRRSGDRQHSDRQPSDQWSQDQWSREHQSRNHQSGDHQSRDRQSQDQPSSDQWTADQWTSDRQSQNQWSADHQSQDQHSVDRWPSDPHSPTLTPPTPRSATLDAVSLPWAERFARALAPLRTEAVGGRAKVSVPLPQVARLLDELGLQRATPASLMARWAAAADDRRSPGGRAVAVLGAGPRGPVALDLVAEGPHAVIAGPAGSGRSELLRAVAASLAAAERPDRLAVVLVDGQGDAAAPGEGLYACTELPHVTTHLTANDPVRMREFAQALSAELKRRAELLGRGDFADWHTAEGNSGSGDTAHGANDRHRVPAPRQGQGQGLGGPRQAQASGAQGLGGVRAQQPGTRDPQSGVRPQHPGSPAQLPHAADDLDAPPSTTLRLRPAASRPNPEPGPQLPRLVVLVDDVDALLAPPLGSPGRPAAGSVVRALEAVARDGARLGVHLVAVCGAQLPEWEAVLGAPVRVTLEAPAKGADDPAPGRGRLDFADGLSTPLQAGRVTGRIPRTATLRPTVVPLEWERMGDPPARRPVRELGNGPTDLALLASALERAARSVEARGVPSLL